MKRRIATIEIKDNMTAEVYDGTQKTSLASVRELVDWLENCPYGKGYTYTLGYCKNLRVDSENIVYELCKDHMMTPEKISLTKAPMGNVYSAMCTDRVTYTVRFAKDSMGRPVELRSLDNLFTGWTPSDLCDAMGNDEWLVAAYDAVQIAIKTLDGKLPVTAASAAYNDFKKSIKKHYDVLFPRLTVDEDDFIRRCYNGGCIMYNVGAHEHIENLHNYNTTRSKISALSTGDGAGYVIDKNSMYPTYMRDYPMPVGRPAKGDIEECWDHIARLEDIDYCCDYHSARLGYDVDRDEARDLETRNMYFLRVNMQMSIKDGCVPCIKWPRAAISDSTNYVVNMPGPQIFYMTEMDFVNVREKYEIYECDILDCYVCETQKGVFKKYVDKWFKVKHDAQNKVEKKVAKLMINSLSGKFAQYVNDKFYIPFVNDKTGTIAYSAEDVQTAENPDDSENLSINDKYIPVAAAITSYGRCEISTVASDNIDILYGGDTDSVFVRDMPVGVKIGDELGEYKIEHEFDASIFVGKKTYAIHDINTGWVIKGAGMSDDTKSEIIARAESIAESYKSNMWMSAASGEQRVNAAYIAAMTPGSVYGGGCAISREPGRTREISCRSYTVRAQHDVNAYVVEHVETEEQTINGFNVEVEVGTVTEVVQVKPEFEQVKYEWTDDDDLPF